MKLVVGLGNPGNQYNFTRHNTGFLALDYYFKLYGLDWEAKPRLGAVFGRAGDVIYIKPQDFYNNSGKVVREYIRYYKINLEDILVICDDFNLNFEDIRYRAKGSAGGNNGLKSIIAELKTDEFARIRIGTGNTTLRETTGDIGFVLSKFTAEEKAALPGVLRGVAERVNEWIIE